MKFFYDNLDHTEDTNLLMFSTSELIDLTLSIAWSFGNLIKRAIDAKIAPMSFDRLDYEHFIRIQGDLISHIVRQVISGNTEIARALANREGAVYSLEGAYVKFHRWAALPTTRVKLALGNPMETAKRFVEICEANRSVPTA